MTKLEIGITSHKDERRLSYSTSAGVLHGCTSRLDL